LLKRGGTVICERNKPFAELRLLGEPATLLPKRRLGQLKGTCPTPPDFFSCDEEIAADFLGESSSPGKIGKRSGSRK
jgi:hypothetical protein